MSKITEPNLWPNIPPWWLISATEVAALLDIHPRTLIAWRARGCAPPPYPPMYLAPTQGNPLWHQYGAVRKWVADQVGSSYDFDDHCELFLKWALPLAANDGGSAKLVDRVEFFEWMLDDAHDSLLAGEAPQAIRKEVVHALDICRARQPRRIGKGKQRAFL